MPSSRFLPSAAVAGILALSACGAQAIAQPADDQFQSWLHREVDGPIPFMIVPLKPSPDSMHIGHALVDALWAQEAYRNHLHAWLSANAAAAASPDDLVFAWEKHYHSAFRNSFAYEPDVVSKVLWRMDGHGIADALPRDLCQSKSPEEIQRLRDADQAALIAKGRDSIVPPVARAIAKEMERQDTTHQERRDDDSAVGKAVMITMHATIEAQPPEDGKRLFDAFSYQPPRVAPQEQCEREWVAAHAVQTGELNEPSKGISSGLMRQSVAQSAFGSRFQRWDTSDIVPIQVKGFTAGKAPLHKPTILIRNGAAGATTLRVHIDAAGQYVSATVTSSTLAPDPLTDIDGAKVNAADPILAAVAAYFHDGRFEPRVVDGSPQPGDIDLEVSWR